MRGRCGAGRGPRARGGGAGGRRLRSTLSEPGRDWTAGSRRAAGGSAGAGPLATQGALGGGSARRGCGLRHLPLPRCLGRPQPPSDTLCPKLPLRAHVLLSPLTSPCVKKCGAGERLGNSTRDMCLSRGKDSPPHPCQLWKRTVTGRGARPGGETQGVLSRATERAARCVPRIFKLPRLKLHLVPFVIIAQEACLSPYKYSNISTA